MPLPTAMIFSIITAMAASAIADMTNRDRRLWGVLGFFGGVIAVAIAWWLPPRDVET